MLQSGVDRVDEGARDPEKLAAYEADTSAKAKRPHLTDAHLEQQWKLVEQLFF